MEFNLEKSIEILHRTPLVLETLLKGLSDEWTNKNEGANTWSPYDVVGHLVHGEKTDWIPRLEIILSDDTDKHFQPFDRFAQSRDSSGKTILDLLIEFRTLRQQSLDTLREKKISAYDLTRTGIHPAFGEVTLQQLLSTWTVHDLGHIAQISRVMAKQYAVEVGPWKEYLPVLTR